MAFTLENSSVAIPNGPMEISIIQAYEDKGPYEGEGKDGLPYYLHNRRYQAKVEEFLGDDDEGTIEAYKTLGGPNPTFTFELAVGDKFLDPALAQELVDAIPEDNEERRDMVRRNIQTARQKATQLLRCHADDKGRDYPFADLVDEMVGERYVIGLSSYTRKNSDRVEYNVNFNRLAEDG